ncbi:MAG: hypothetical protein IJ566_00960 [Cardiobacteriaceae bacterium]|nr:hypothetical protein [Cardiobacteriaceae bacterium]
MSKEIKIPAFAILDNLSTCVILSSNKSEMLYINSACENLLGKSRKQVYKKQLGEYFIYAESGKRFTAPVPKNNNFSVNEYAIPLFLPTQQTQISADISINQLEEWIIIEIRVQNPAINLQHTNQSSLQVKSNRNIFSNLAHEIRNPLAGIKGAAQILENCDATKKNKYINLILQQVEKLNSLVLQMSNGSKAQKTLCNIHRIIEEARMVFSINEEYKNIKIIRDYDPGLPEIYIDSGQIQRVILNLLTNGAKSMNLNGVIIIKTRIKHGEILLGKRYKTTLAIEIIDNGTGIEENLIDAVFQPMISHFQEGSGLGLPISQDIAHRHDGVIKLLNSNEKGSSFVLLLPYINYAKNFTQNY